MWRRRKPEAPFTLSQLDDVIELLAGSATMLMEIDQKLDIIVAILEERE